jgi:anthranilate phosphoribosyltransferase
MFSIKSLLDKLEAGGILGRDEAEFLMQQILSGTMETPLLVRLLQAFNQRPVDANELTGFATIIRQHAAPVFASGEVRPAWMVDTCGTGGDGCNTFNISTAAAFVAAAAGATVAKHGNRAASSRSGSADVLEALGVRIDLSPLQVGRVIREVGIGFLFAPSVHSAMRHAAPARKEIGKRTVFNLLGPLTNPVGAEAQVVGVYSSDLLDPVASALVALKIGHAFVVSGAGGLDEISLEGETRVAEVRGTQIRRYTITPENFAVARAPLACLVGGSAAENAAIILDLFQQDYGPRRDVVVINAAAALVASGRANNLLQGAILASEAIRSGAALDKLERLIAFTNSMPRENSPLL